MAKSNFQSFRQHLIEFKGQLLHSFVVVGENKKIPKIDCIYVCGMGGSGIAGDVISTLFKDKNPEVLAWKNYGLPKKKNAGFLFVSFSGDTEETLSAIKVALKTNPSRILGVVTSGGALKKIAEKKNLRRVIIPKEDLTPREAVGYNVNASLTLLRSIFPLFRAHSVSLISNKILESTGRKLARKIVGTVPLVYTEERDRVIGYAWKMYIDETGKTPCFINVIPEMNHNEIQSFEKTKIPFSVIFLAEKKSSARIAKRVRASAEILRHRKIKTMFVNIRGKSTVERLWNGILLGSWTGLYIANLKKTDPKATPAIASLKKLIKN